MHCSPKSTPIVWITSSSLSKFTRAVGQTPAVTSAPQARYAKARHVGVRIHRRERQSPAGTSTPGRLLLSHAVNCAKSPDQIPAVDGNDLAVGKYIRQNV